MKAKDLAEQLLKYPDFDVEFNICMVYPSYEHPWAEYKTFGICGIEDIAHSDKVIVLEVTD